jgi:hypothetical protein
LPLVREALAAIGTGGYPHAVALAAMLIGKGTGPIPLARLELIDRLTRSDETLAQLSDEAWRRIKAEQAVVAELEPAAGLRSLPKLLPRVKERRAVLNLLDEALAATELTPEQHAMLARIQHVLAEAPTQPPSGPAARERAGAT